VGAAVQTLQGADEELLQTFCGEILPRYNAEEQVTVLAMLLKRHTRENQQLLGQLLGCGLRAPAETLLKLLKELQADGPKWSDFWLEGNHLALLLASVKSQGDGAAPLWARFAAGLNRELLFGGKDQRRLFARLEEARNALQKAAPPQAAALLDDWGLLLRQFDSPGNGPGPQEVSAVCRRRCGVEFEPLLREYFAKAVQALPVDGPECGRFSDTVKAFYPQYAPREYQQGLALFSRWLEIVRDCPDAAKRAEFQLLFATRHIPLEHHSSLAQDLKAKLPRQTYKALKSANPASPPKAAAMSGAPLDTDGGNETSWLTSLSPRTKLIAALAVSHLLLFVVAFAIGRSQAQDSSALQAELAAIETKLKREQEEVKKLREPQDKALGKMEEQQTTREALFYKAFVALAEVLDAEQNSPRQKLDKNQDSITLKRHRDLSAKMAKVLEGLPKPRGGTEGAEGRDALTRLTSIKGTYDQLVEKLSAKHAAARQRELVVTKTVGSAVAIRAAVAPAVLLWSQRLAELRPGNLPPPPK
jgi:hypothetical protein